MEIIDALKKKRPNLSEKSLKAYGSTLGSLFKKVFPDTKLKLSKFKETNTIMEFLKDLEPNKRKSVLSALFVLTNKSAYKTQMLEDVNNYNNNVSKQEKTEAQEANWVSQTDIKELLDKLKKKVSPLFKETKFKNKDYQDLQDYVLLALMSGAYIPPRRSMDYTEFKISNVDKDVDNYLEGDKLVFNKYKTSKAYGEQEVTIPKELKLILTKWIKINPTEYLFFDNNKNKLTSSKVTNRLNKIFDKKVSVNMLRASFLTDKYGESIDIKKALAKDMKMMGSSTAQQNHYIKDQEE
jgi:site-specific recombinase XerD